VDDARERVNRWVQDAPSFLEMVAQVVDDRQRALAAAEDTARECERLREKLAAARGESEGLKRDHSETASLLAEALGRAGEALVRLRAASDVVAKPALPPPPPLDVEPIPPREAAEGAGARRILLVDDDTNFRNVMMEYLAGCRGYDVRAAVSGEDGLTALTESLPDIVLLDLMMPGIGGIATLQRMKALYPDLCVVMVTANEDLSIARKALGLGAADYVTKPFDLDYLDAVLNIYLSKSEACPEREPAALAGADEVGPVAAATRSVRSYFARR
jgi:CheY-like chemotaxis protein